MKGFDSIQNNQRRATNQPTDIQQCDDLDDEKEDVEHTGTPHKLPEKLSVECSDAVVDPHAVMVHLLSNHQVYLENTALACFAMVCSRRFPFVVFALLAGLVVDFQVGKLGRRLFYFEYYIHPWHVARITEASTHVGNH